MSRGLHVAGRMAWIVAAILVVYLLITLIQVWHASTRNEAGPAQAIIVLGAAQYDGRPSPVFEARLRHAADLYRAGHAPLVVVTGGRRPGDRFTEAQAAVAYLHARGVPEMALRREVDARNTWESLAAVSRFLRDEGVSDVLLVSDPSHAFRIADIAEEVGLQARVSPTPESAITGVRAFRQMLRETAAVAVGRLIGYRRLSNVGGEIGIPGVTGDIRVSLNSREIFAIP